MSKMSIFDKIQIVFEVSKTSKLYFLVVLVFVALGLSLSMSNSKNKNTQKIIYLMITTFITVFSIVSYHASLGNMFSYMMDNFFIVLYFPNIATYIAAIIATNIILWISIFSFKATKPIRNLNIVVYTILSYIFILLLNVVNNKRLDIFNQEAIYGNKQAHALISVSSIIFTIWIIFLIVYKIIIIYLKKEYAPKIKKVIVKKKVKKLPDNYEPTIFPEYIYGKLPRMVNNKPSIQMESRFTLQDYKLFSKILKEQSMQEQDLETFEIAEDSSKTDEQINKVEDQIESIKKEEEQTIIEENSISNQIDNEEKNTNKEDTFKEIEKALKEINLELDNYEKENKKEKNKIDDEKERENKKYTELEMLYRGIY